MTRATPLPCRRGPTALGLALLTSLLLAEAAAAQKVFDAVNENPSRLLFAMTGPAWFAHKRAYTAPVTITAVEFLLVGWNAAPSVTLDVGIWDEDPTTGAPRALLGSGSSWCRRTCPAGTARG